MIGASPASNSSLTRPYTMLHPFQVYRFYEYWINFESWRDFTGVGAEHKIDDAMSRDEKRYYAKVCRT